MLVLEILFMEDIMTQPGVPFTRKNIFAETIDLESLDTLWMIVHTLTSCGGLVWRDDREPTILALTYTANVLVSSYIKVKARNGNIEDVMEALVFVLGSAAIAVDQQIIPVMLERSRFGTLHLMS